MGNRKLNVIIIMVVSSLLGCKTNTDQNTIKLVFEFNNKEQVFDNPSICKRQGQTFYFGIPNTEMNKIDAKSIQVIKVKRISNNVVANAKPIEVLSSNLPDSDSFFTLDTIRNSIGDYINKNITWFIVHNNPRNEDKLSNVMNNVKTVECSW